MKFMCIPDGSILDMTTYLFKGIVAYFAVGLSILLIIFIAAMLYFTIQEMGKK